MSAVCWPIIAAASWPLAMSAVAWDMSKTPENAPEIFAASALSISRLSGALSDISKKTRAAASFLLSSDTVFGKYGAVFFQAASRIASG